MKQNQVGVPIMSLKQISTNYKTMSEIQERLASNEAKKARRLLETAMSARQAFKIMETQVTKDVLRGLPSNFPQIEELKDI